MAYLKGEYNLLMRNNKQWIRLSNKSKSLQAKRVSIGIVKPKTTKCGNE